VTPDAQTKLPLQSFPIWYIHAGPPPHCEVVCAHVFVSTQQSSVLAKQFVEHGVFGVRTLVHASEPTSAGASFVVTSAGASLVVVSAGASCVDASPSWQTPLPFTSVQTSAPLHVLFGKQGPPSAP
jgi:hypothetical protein